MRTDKDYKKLTEGYRLSLSILNLLYRKHYENFIKAKEALNRAGNHFSLMVRDLRIDYFSGNDDKPATDPKAIVLENGLAKEMFAISYCPESDYDLIFLYQKNGLIFEKKIFFEIHSATLEDIRNDEYQCLFRTTTIDKEGKPGKIYQFIGLVDGEELVVFKQDMDKPTAFKGYWIVPLSELEDIQIEKNMF